jgi:hypothetical protein
VKQWRRPCRPELVDIFKKNVPARRPAPTKAQAAIGHYFWHLLHYAGYMHPLLAQSLILNICICVLLLFWLCDPAASWPQSN